jgi:hypothetical protein
LQEATDTYKALLLEHRELLALNMYVALCYAKLDYYDVSSEILQVTTALCTCPCYTCCRLFGLLAHQQERNARLHS